MKKKILYILAILTINFELISKNYNNSKFDVTVIGSIKFADGRGRLPIGFIENLKDKLKINFISTEGLLDFNNVNQDIKNIALNEDKTPGNVALLFTSVCADCASYVPNSPIKLVYSTFETTDIPKYWINLLNNNFDAVLVPSEFLVKTYKKSGIKIPVFLAPHGIYIDEFLNTPIKSQKNEIFTFGTSAGFWPHKNHELLLKAFLEKFHNNPKVKLKIHGRFGDQRVIQNLKKIIRDSKAKNVELITKCHTPDEHLKFMQSLDCYVLVSKGEGFSVTPRESIALGIPTIISNNTAHKELSKTPYFLPVKSNVKELSNFTQDLGTYCGYNFNTNQKYLENALETVYNNYEDHLAIASKGREWVKQFTYKSLEKQYLNIIKPEKVIFGTENIIKNDYLMTTSKKLYEKYLILK